MENIEFVKIGSIMNIQGRLARRAYKRRGAFFSVETAFYFIVIAIVAALVIGIFQFLDDARVSTAQQELDQIRSAVLSYRTYRMDQELPTDLTVLLNEGCISATDSIDNREHGPFLNTTSNRWSSNGLMDPWGHAYQIETGGDDRGAYVYSTAGSESNGEDKWIKSYVNAATVND